MTKPEKIKAEDIKARMKALSITSQALADETGCDNTNVSAWVNGSRPMSKTVKNMFHWYLKVKENEQRAIEDKRWEQTDAEKYSDFKNGLSFGMK